MRVPSTAGALLALVLPAAAGAQRQPTPASPTAAPPVPGARPQPGRWAGVVSNGFKGDSIFFTVTADGVRLRDVTFAGYWRCADGSYGGSLEQTRVGPPDTVPVRAGAFASTQTRPVWWWSVEGRFPTPATAEGTYRQAAKSATCDTRVLRWTAQRVGN